MMKSLTIGIATYNRHDMLRKCLNHLSKQTIMPNHVIIVDSTPALLPEDDLAALRAKTHVSYIKLDEKTPLPKGRNIILNHCNTDIISFIDDDALPKEHFVEAVIESFENSSIAGITGPTINSSPDLTPLLPLLTDNKNRTRVRIWGDVYSDTRRWVPSHPVLCESMIGANMSFNTKILKQVGGFDESFINPSFREDTDPQISILKMGYQFLYHPDVYVYHIVEQPGGIEDIEKKKNLYFYLAGKNHRYFCDKHFPKLLTRLAWIFWNRTPPNFILAILLSIFRKENYLMWHKGLWSKSGTTHREME